jgi:hypothetical protein
LPDLIPQVVRAFATPDDADRGHLDPHDLWGVGAGTSRFDNPTPENRTACRTGETSRARPDPGQLDHDALEH